MFLFCYVLGKTISKKICLHNLKLILWKMNIVSLYNVSLIRIWRTDQETAMEKTKHVFFTFFVRFWTRYSNHFHQTLKCLVYILFKTFTVNKSMWKKISLCLNLWSEKEALMSTPPAWFHSVDQCVAFKKNCMKIVFTIWTDSNISCVQYFYMY